MREVDGTVALELCPPGIMDGWLIHSSAVARGLATWLLSGQVLYVRNSEEQELSFSHGVPEQTKLSAAVIVQDKRIRRALLEQRGIKTPRGASFSLGKGLPGAERYAKRLGYPVVLKPAQGENSVEVRANVRSRRDLVKGVEYYRTAPALREEFELSSYTLTTLFWPKDIGGTETRDDYRVVVEEHVRGKYLRFFLLGAEVVSCVYAPGRTWDPAEGGGDVLDELHPRIARLARKVARTFPRLYALTVDVVVEDWGQSPESQQYSVVEVAERPWHHVRGHYIGTGVYNLAALTLERSAEDAGYRLPTSTNADVVSVELRWDGVSNPEAFLRAYAEESTTRGLVGDVWVEDKISGLVKAHVQGRPADIALVSELSVEGGLSVNRVMSVESQPLKRSDVNFSKERTGVEAVRMSNRAE